MNKLNKTESAIFVSLMCSFLPGIFIQNLFGNGIMGFSKRKELAEDVIGCLGFTAL